MNYKAKTAILMPGNGSIWLYGLVELVTLPFPRSKTFPFNLMLLYSWCSHTLVEINLSVLDH